MRSWALAACSIVRCEIGTARTAAAARALFAIAWIAIVAAAFLDRYRAGGFSSRMVGFGAVILLAHRTAAAVLLLGRRQQTGAHGSNSNTNSCESRVEVVAVVS